MAEPVLLIDRADGVATLTLNRPQALNALSRELRRRLRDAFIEVPRAGDVDVLILTGAGRAFCAGLDLKELGGETASEGELAATVAGGDESLLDTMARCRLPVIGAINGFAITGGFELALGCDILIASTEARFADTHARVGILPGWGLSQKLSRIVGIHRAKELSLTGNYLPAEQAAAWGLVNRVVPKAELLAVCRALAADIRSAPQDVVRAYKRVIDAGFATTLAEGLRVEAEANREHARTLTPDAIAARRAGVQARGRDQSAG
jgi:enoyl-CoA hydratase/carnithine racemase